jgi:hypothetical protein
MIGYESHIEQQQTANHKTAHTRVWVPPKNKALKESPQIIPANCVLS